MGAVVVWMVTTAMVTHGNYSYCWLLTLVNKSVLIKVCGVTCVGWWVGMRLQSSSIVGCAAQRTVSHLRHTDVLVWYTSSNKVNKFIHINHNNAEISWLLMTCNNKLWFCINTDNRSTQPFCRSLCLQWTMSPLCYMTVCFNMNSRLLCNNWLWAATKLGDKS